MKKYEVVEYLTGHRVTVVSANSDEEAWHLSRSVPDSDWVEQFETVDCEVVEVNT